MTLPVDVRPATAGDLPFILNSWLRSYRDASEFGTSLRKSVYFTHYRPVVELLLSRAHVAVACPADDPSTICGWICYELDAGTTTVHYAYVKQSFRRMGLLGVMLERLGVDDWVFKCSHQTRAALDILRDKTTVVYDPRLTS